MAKIKTKIDNYFCPQALFLYGTKQEDGRPHCEQLVKNDKKKAVCISTSHVGFYEKHRYEFYKTMKVIADENSKVYKKQL